MVTIKSTVIEIKNAFNGAPLQLRKESLSFRICQQKSSKLKNKETETEKTEYPRIVSNCKKNTRKRKQERIEDIFETVVTEDFLK